MTKLSTCLIGALLAAGFATAASAEIYRWVGDGGLTHYGDRPPPGANAVRVQPETGNFGSFPAPRAAATESEEPAAEEAGTESASGDVDSPERTARIRGEQCAKARERLENYSNAAQIQIRQEDGGTRDMTPEERVQAIARAESDVAHFCEEE